MNDQQEFAERFKDMPIAPSVEAWAEYVGPILGAIVVLGDRVPEETRTQMLEKAFGTMPLDLSIKSAIKIISLAESIHAGKPGN